MVEDAQIVDFNEKMAMGMRVDQFLVCLDNFYGVTRLLGMVDRYRKGERPLKTLRDEITPFARYVRRFAKPDHIVSKPKDDPPDFIIVEGGTARQIECTTAGANARRFMLQELEKNAASEEQVPHSMRAFVGLPDDSSDDAFANAMAKDPQMYTTDEARSVILKNVKIAIKKKLKIAKGDILLIEILGMLVLQEHHWNEFKPEFMKAAKEATNFNEVYLVGYLAPEQFCFRAK